MREATDTLFRTRAMLAVRLRPRRDLVDPRQQERRDGLPRDAALRRLLHRLGDDALHLRFVQRIAIRDGVGDQKPRA